jgi:hypothetical protein
MPRLRVRRSKPATIDADVVRQMRDLVRGEPELHPELWARWSFIAGPLIANRALPLSLRKKVLTVVVENSSWLHELSFLKGMLLGRIAEEIGPTKVRDVRFMLDPKAFVRKRTMRFAPKAKRAQPLPRDIQAALAKVEDPGLAEIMARAIVAALPDDPVR